MELLTFARQFLLPIVEIGLIGIERRNRFGQLGFELRLFRLPFAERVLDDGRDQRQLRWHDMTIVTSRPARTDNPTCAVAAHYTDGIKRNWPREKGLFMEQSAGELTLESAPAI